MSSNIIYIPIQKAYFMFYTKVDKKVKLLLFSKNNTNELSTIYTKVNKYDTAPTFSVSRELTVTFNKLFTNEIIEKIIKKEQLTKSDLELSYAKYMQYKLWHEPTHKFWLNEISKNSIIQYDDIKETVIYFKEIPDIDINYLNTELNKNNYFCKFEYISENNTNYNYTSDLKELLNKVSIDNLINHIQDSIIYRETNELPTYIILACKKSGKDQEGFFHFPALLTGIYRRNNENWLYSLTSLHQFPDDALLKKTKCIFIPGSELNVYNNIEFLIKTKEFLQKLIPQVLFENKYPQLKFLGTCFGMQMIISALGGEVKRSNIIQRFPVDIKLKDKFWDFNFVKKSGIVKQPMKICQAHGDHVIKAPDSKYNVELIGSSENCKFEVLVDKQEKIFLIEGHPEYSPMFLSMKGVEWYLSFEKLEATESNVKAFLDKSEKNADNQNNKFNEWRALCYTFMKSS